MCSQHIPTFSCTLLVLLMQIQANISIHSSFSLAIVFVLKSILSEMRIATAAFFWFPFAWNIFFHPFTFSRTCPYVWNGSLVDRIYIGIVFVAIQPVYVFWLEHLIHLHLRGLSICMFLLPFLNCFGFVIVGLFLLCDSCLEKFL